MRKPKVTVLMPIYNGETYLKQAIESILKQTFSDFEFLIINDGSIDASVDIIQSIKDNRIRVVHNESNLSLVPTLNKGLELSRGEYVVRMDCDDISLPERLDKQVAFMDHYQEVGVCGTWMRKIGITQGQIFKRPTDDASIRCGMLFNNMLLHPSVIIRKKLIDDFSFRYDSHFKHAEDYELWIRCSEHASLANINEVLLEYRWHEGNISNRFKNEQDLSANQIRRNTLKKLNIDPSHDEFELHLSIAKQKFEINKNFIDRLEAWLCTMKNANRSTCYYPEPTFSTLLFRHWCAACTNATELGWWTFKKFFNSLLNENTNVTFKQKISFAKQCFFAKPPGYRFNNS